MIIGITTTYIEQDRVERATVEYIQRVAATGAVPVLLPPVEGGPSENRRAARELADRIDALVLAGGGDVDPARYGDKSQLPETTYVSQTRDALELELARLAHERDLPTLGICRGMQVLNVALGGTLHQDINACGVTKVKHQQEPPYDDVWQRVDIERDSLLGKALLRSRYAGAVSTHPFMVNSMHHQAVSRLADGLAITAMSDDGLIEGVEDPTRRFFLGVQWHPEYLDDNAPLFAALAAAASKASADARADNKNDLKR